MTNHAPDVSRRQRWIVPALCLFAGIGYVAIFLYRREPWMAVSGFVIMAVYGLVLVLASRRSETAAVLRGELTDERRVDINRQASAFTLNVLILVALGGFVISLLQGHDGNPWILICAVAGATYLGSTTYFTRHR